MSDAERVAFLLYASIGITMLAIVLLIIMIAMIVRMRNTR